MPATIATPLAGPPDGEAMPVLEATIGGGLRPSARRHGFVPRARLVARLLEPTYVPLVLLVAPAGFGKTTLLAEWAEGDARPFTFVTPDPDRNGLAPVSALRRAIADHECPTVVVVDDAHLIGDDSMGELATLVDHLPAGSQLAIASRSEPRLPVGRLRAHRRVLELRSTELAMTRTESAALLAAAGLDLEPSQVDTLVRRTEGWPAGLYLAALPLRDQPNTGKALAGWTGDDRLVADYLRDELLSRALAGRAEFLLRTSVLDKAVRPAVRRRAGAARLRRHARRRLVPLEPAARSARPPG